MASKYKSLLNDTVIFAIGSIGSKFISFILVPYYTNLLTTSEYGVVDLVTSFSNLMVPIASLVIHEAVLRFGLSEKVKSKSVISNACVVLIASFFLILCFSPILGLYKSISQWVPQLIFISIMTMTNNTFISYVKVKNKNKIYSIISIVHALTFALLNIILMSTFEMKIVGYLSANIIALFLTSIALLFFTGIIKDIRIKNVDFRLMKQMLIYSSPLVFNSISWWIIHSISKILLETNLSTTALGLFSAASKIPALLAIFTTIFQQAWVLSAIKDYENGIDKKFFANIFNYYSVFMIIGTSVIVTAAKPIMSFYVGSAFFESWRYVPVLLLGILYNAYSAFFGSIYSAAKKNKQIASSTVMSSLITLVLSLLLIPQFGIMGAAIANTCSYVFIGIIRCIGSRKYIKVDINFGRHLLCHAVVLAQIILTCNDIYIYIVGLISVILLIIINNKSIVSFCNESKKKLKKE